MGRSPPGGGGADFDPNRSRKAFRSPPPGELAPPPGVRKGPHLREFGPVFPTPLLQVRCMSSPRHPSVRVCGPVRGHGPPSPSLPRPPESAPKRERGAQAGFQRLLGGTRRRASHGRGGRLRGGRVAARRAGRVRPEMLADVRRCWPKLRPGFGRCRGAVSAKLRPVSTNPAAPLRIHHAVGVAEGLCSANAHKEGRVLRSFEQPPMAHPTKSAQASSASWNTCVNCRLCC